MLGTEGVQQNVSFWSNAELFVITQTSFSLHLFISNK